MDNLPNNGEMVNPELLRQLRPLAEQAGIDLPNITQLVPIINMKSSVNVITPCPQSGGGVHLWIMESAWSARKAMIPEVEAVEVIAAQISRPPSPQNEIESAVCKVYATPEQNRNGSRRRKLPPADVEAVARIAADGPAVADLQAMSPVRLKSGRRHTCEVLRELFPGDPWLCIGDDRRFETLRLADIVARNHPGPKIVPNPMLSKWGRTASGKNSQHTLEATGPRRFVIVEGDRTSKDAQAAVIVRLAACAPLALVVDSGGKSLHAWFFCAGRDEAALEPFFVEAARLGADPALFRNRSQFVRLPDGIRAETGKRQAIIFFRPEVIR